MDATHLHLMLTHFPIVGTIIGACILIYALLSKNDSVMKVAFVTFILMALLTIPVFLTGGESEETVEHLAGVSENIIEEHEELAEKAIWLMGLLGIFSILNIFIILKRSSFVKSVTIISLIIALVTIGFFVQVGNLGGQIRHSEIRAINVDLNDAEHSIKKINKKDDDN